MSESQTYQSPQHVFARNFQAAVERACMNGKTVTELADYVGIPRTAVYSIINSGRKVDPPEMKLWCQVLNVTFDELVG
jgi:plasmid maintenance system antidote protein VapI